VLQVYPVLFAVVIHAKNFHDCDSIGRRKILSASSMGPRGTYNPSADSGFTGDLWAQPC